MLHLKPLLFIAIGALGLTACEDSSTTAATPAASSTQAEAVQTPATPPVAQTAVVQPAPAAEKEPSPEFASLPAPYVDADYARAKRVWRQCSSCHTVAADANHLVGPNLYGLFGRVAGTEEGFNYSTALKEAGFEWTPEKLDEWLASPRNFLPRNRMSFAGVRKPADRNNVIAYLMVESTK